MNRNEKLGVALLANIVAFIITWIVCVDIGFGAVFEGSDKLWILSQVLQYTSLGIIVPTLIYFSRDWIKMGVGGVLFGGFSMLVIAMTLIFQGYSNVMWLMAMLFAGAMIPIINGIIVAYMVDEGTL